MKIFEMKFHIIFLSMLLWLSGILTVLHFKTLFDYTISYKYNLMELSFGNIFSLFTAEAKMYLIFCMLIWTSALVPYWFFVLISGLYLFEFYQFMWSMLKVSLIFAFYLKFYLPKLDQFYIFFNINSSTLALVFTPDLEDFIFLSISFQIFAVMLLALIMQFDSLLFLISILLWAPLTVVLVLKELSIILIQFHVDFSINCKSKS